MSLLINHFYRFGEFTIDTDQGVLLREGKPVALAPKVFDTLLILVENAGRIVTKEELLNRVWPDTFVEEANLSYNVQQLRRAVGDTPRNPIYIETIPRRGYRFIAQVEEVLSDAGMKGSQIAQRFETSDVQPPDPGQELNRPVETQHSEPALRASKSYIALAAALVVVLVVVGLVLWRLSSGSNKSADETRRVDAKSPLALPLKLEKLTGTGQSSHVAISPDGKYLAYTQVIEKRPSIWLRQLATNTNVEIVPAAGPELIHGLVFANSGEYLYFVRGEPTALYRVSLLGGVPTKIVDNLEGNFSLSADDGQIVFVRRVINQDGQREVFLTTVNADGTGNRALLSTAHPNTLNVPLWSPDGRSIICAYYSRASGNQDASLIEVSVADGVKKELSSERFFQIAKLAWLPDKSGLIMSASRKHEDDNQLWQITYPGIEISQITEGIANFADLSIAATADKAAAAQAIHIAHIWVGSSREPLTLKKIVQGTNNFSWARNGQIIYSSKSSGNVDVWAMKPDGTGQRQLTVNPAIDGMPAVTPDSRYIVFVSNRTGAYEIWRMNMDGSNQTQLTNSGGSRPAISPDGKWVLYNTSSLHLWKVSIEGGEPAQLTEYAAYASAVSPDGKMIACVGRNESSRKLSVLVLPFEGGQPLKRLEFAGGGFRGFRVDWTPDGKALIYGIENNGKTAIIKQSLDGGQPQQIMDFDEDEMFDFGYSSDRKLFAVTRGAWQHDIVLISGLNQY